MTGIHRQLRTNLVSEPLGRAVPGRQTPVARHTRGAVLCGVGWQRLGSVSISLNWKAGRRRVCFARLEGRQPPASPCTGIAMDCFLCGASTSRIRITKLTFWTTYFLFLRSTVKNNYDGRNLWFLSSTVTNLYLLSHMPDGGRAVPLLCGYLGTIMPRFVWCWCMPFTITPPYPWGHMLVCQYATSRWCCCCLRPSSSCFLGMFLVKCYFFSVL